MNSNSNNQNTLVLVVEDDRSVANLIATTLKVNQYRFLRAATAEAALLETVSRRPDIILLDLGLPDGNGLELIRKIRTWSQTPIIVVSARSEERDKVQALDAGANDYITKPFSVEELLARLRVAQRMVEMLRKEGEPEASEFVNGALRIDYLAGCAYIKNRELKLTPGEYKLLVILSKNAGKVLTHNYLTKAMWGTCMENDVATLRVFLATLRKKIEAEPDSPQYIQTHIGVGYRMLRVDQGVCESI